MLLLAGKNDNFSPQSRHPHAHKLVSAQGVEGFFGGLSLPTRVFYQGLFPRLAKHPNCCKVGPPMDPLSSPHVVIYLPASHADMQLPSMGTIKDGKNVN